MLINGLPTPTFVINGAITCGPLHPYGCSTFPIIEI
jgi:hypothetical protein